MESLYYTTHPCSFDWYHPRPPTASSSARLGFATPTQNSNDRYYLRNGWSYGHQIWPEHSQGISEHKPKKEKRERGRIQGLPNFFVYPLLSQEQVNYELQILYAYSWRQSEEKSIKNFGKSTRGRSQGLPEIFSALIWGASRGHLCDSSAFLYSYSPGVAVWVLWRRQPTAHEL